MKILLAQPRGFCAGVDRAIAIVERALAVHGVPIYVRHEIVHNKHVVNSLREKGSIFVNEIDEVPDGSVLENPEKVAYVSQTTISYDDAKGLIQELKKRFPLVAEPKKADICYATQNRQDAVKELARRVDLVLVVGSKSSSNSNRLREVAEGAGTKAYLLDDAGEINPDWFKGIERVGITAGASAPEILVDEIVEKLKTLGADEVETMAGQQEDVKFPLPKGLWKKDLENARDNQK